MNDPAPLTLTPTGEEYIESPSGGKDPVLVKRFKVSVTLECAAHYISSGDEEIDKTHKITGMKVSARELFGMALFGEKEWDNICYGRRGA